MKLKLQDKILELLALVLLIGIPAQTILAFADLPETIAIHFDFNGNANGWGSKNTLWIFSLIGLLLFSLLTFLSRRPELSNLRYTEATKEKQYSILKRMFRVIKITILLFFNFLQFILIESASKANLQFPYLFILLIILLVLPIAYYMYKISRLNQ